MSFVRNRVARTRRILANDSGASIVEYGVLTAGIVTVAVAAAATLSTTIGDMMTSINTTLKTAVTTVTTKK